MSGVQKHRRTIAQTLAERTEDIEYTSDEARARLTEDGVDVEKFLKRLRQRADDLEAGRE